MPLIFSCGENEEKYNTEQSENTEKQKSTIQSNCIVEDSIEEQIQTDSIVDTICNEYKWWEDSIYIKELNEYDDPCGTEFEDIVK